MAIYANELRPHGQYRVFAISNVDAHAQRFIDANGGAEFLDRVIASVPVTHLGKKKFTGSLQASRIPVQIVKLGQDPNPNDVDHHEVLVSHKPFRQLGDEDHLLENLTTMDHIWTHLRNLRKRGEVAEVGGREIRIPDLRTSVPLFVLTHRDGTQILVSIKSQHRTVADHVRDLKAAGENRKAEQLIRDLAAHVRDLGDLGIRIRRGLQLSHADDFFYNPDQEGSKRFILVMPRGGRVLPPWGLKVHD